MNHLDELLHGLAGTWTSRVATAAVATLVILFVVSRLRSLLERLGDRLARVLGSRGRGIGVRSVELVSVDLLVRSMRWALGAVRLALGFGLFYVWLLVVSFSLDRSRRYFDLVMAPLRTAAATAGEALLGFVPNLMMLAVIVVVARLAQRTLGVLLDAVATRRLHLTWLSPEVVPPTRRLATVLVVVFAFVFAFPHLPGADSKAFQGVSVLVGVVVSLGSSSVVSNLLSGLVLTYVRAFRVGDRVKIGDVVGDVTALGAFTTRLRTLYDEEIVLPNALVQSSAVLNQSAYAETRGVEVRTEVTIGYEVPWRLVHRLLLDAARATKGLVDEPAPYVLQRELHDFYVRYEIRAHTRRANEHHLITADLCEHVQDAFFAANVEICSPHYRAVRDGSKVQIPPGGGLDVPARRRPSAPDLPVAEAAVTPAPRPAGDGGAP